MTLAVTQTRMTSDRSDVCAVSVGLGQWVIKDRLHGRTFSQSQALGVVQFAHVIGDGRLLHPPGHPIWIDVRAWLDSVGLTLREAVLLLDLPCDLRELPSGLITDSRVVDAIDASSSPVRSVLGALIGWWR
jgi:hypothetical protein